MVLREPRQALFYLAQQAVALRPVPYDRIVHPTSQGTEDEGHAIIHKGYLSRSDTHLNAIESQIQTTVMKAEATKRPFHKLRYDFLLDTPRCVEALQKIRLTNYGVRADTDLNDAPVPSTASMMMLCFSPRIGGISTYLVGRYWQLRYE